MGRHAADWPAPDSSSYRDRGRTPAHRLPLHADLFVPTPGTAAARTAEERAAAAFERLVRAHQPALRAYVSRLTDGDDALADIVVKETLYRAAREPERYPQRASGVRPWLVLIARNVLRDGERRAPAGHDDRPAPADPAAQRFAAQPHSGTTVTGAD